MIYTKVLIDPTNKLMQAGMVVFIACLFSQSVSGLSAVVTPSSGTAISLTGQEGEQKNIQFSIANNGQGGILAFYSISPYSEWKLMTPNCISPGQTGTGVAYVSIPKGANSFTLKFTLMDFWTIFQGDKCSLVNPKDYQTASTQLYSFGNGERTVNTYSGCQYNSPNCDSNHNCVSNECVLKPGCQYSNPPCASNQDCLSNQCVLKNGCLYNNPPCDSNHDCISNNCVLKAGCQYNNPPCGEGNKCLGNECIAVLTDSKASQIRSKIDSLETKLSAIKTNALILQEKSKSLYLILQTIPSTPWKMRQEMP